MISTNYPLYSVISLGNGQIAIAGGGGSSKTGVPNALEVHQLSETGSGIESEQLAHIDTASSAVMNCSAIHHHGSKAIACGMDQHCGIVNVVSASPTKGSPTKGLPTKGVRNRQAKKQSKPSEAVALTLGQKKQTDFHEKYALQKVVRFCPRLNMMSTGGADGRIRFWEYPTLKQLNVTDRLHTDDVDDLDFHPSQPLVVSVSCDKQCFVWNMNNGKNVGQLKFTKSPAGQPYKFRSCRFLPSLPGGASSAEASLVTTHSPVSLHRPPASYVCLWQATGDCKTWTEAKWVAIGKDPVSCLSCLTTKSGRFVGIGDMLGGVRILDDSLKTLYSARAVHEMFITSVALTVLPSTKATSELPVLVSVSDRCCKITRVQTAYKDTLMLLLVVVLVVGAFVIVMRMV